MCDATTRQTTAPTQLLADFFTAVSPDASTHNAAGLPAQDVADAAAPSALATGRDRHRGRQFRARRCLFRPMVDARGDGMGTTRALSIGKAHHIGPRTELRLPFVASDSVGPHGACGDAGFDPSYNEPYTQRLAALHVGTRMTRPFRVRACIPLSPKPGDVELVCGPRLVGPAVVCAAPLSAYESDHSLVPLVPPMALPAEVAHTSFCCLCHAAMSITFDSTSTRPQRLRIQSRHFLTRTGLACIVPHPNVGDA